MINGVFLIDKDCQTTSRKLDNQVGRLFGIKKVGHVGTLDPLATGLMLVAVNEGTKAIPFLEDATKEYVASFQLGRLTTTLDLEGEEVLNQDVTKLSHDSLETTLRSFLGKITQIPPLTSAIKVDGVPLYKYAHKNIKFDVPAREVTIFSIELIDYIHPIFTIKTTVSSGTYIRTLGNDIAHKLGTVATTVKLRRTKVGNFHVDAAKNLENLCENDIIGLGQLLSHIPTALVDESQLRRVQVGAKIELIDAAERVKIVHEDKLLAIYQKIEEQTYQCLRGFNL